MSDKKELSELAPEEKDSGQGHKIMARFTDCTGRYYRILLLLRLRIYRCRSPVLPLHLHMQSGGSSFMP